MPDRGGEGVGETGANGLKEYKLASYKNCQGDVKESLRNVVNNIVVTMSNDRWLLEVS